MKYHIYESLRDCVVIGVSIMAHDAPHDFFVAHTPKDVTHVGEINITGDTNLLDEFIIIREAE